MPGSMRRARTSCGGHVRGGGALWIAVAACSQPVDPSAGSLSAGGSDAVTATDGADTLTSAAATSGASADETASGVPGTDTSDGLKFDAPDGATHGDSVGGSQCTVVDDMDAVAPCTEKAPPGSFDPEVQWAWPGEMGETQIITTPVVANLTDDNADGAIDLCDIPDVVVAAYQVVGGAPYPGYPPQTSASGSSHLWVIDGGTGLSHFRIAEPINPHTNPAIADIDGDGIPEIVSLTHDTGHLVAFEHDGSLRWESNGAFGGGQQAAVAIHDLDADGDVEIILRDRVADHQGNELFQAEGAGGLTASTAADLDGDDDLELVFGDLAYHHDGTLYYDAGITPDGFYPETQPQIADLDGDGMPEVMVVSSCGVSILEHDGTPKLVCQGFADRRPAAIHDVDGDGTPEMLVGASNTYSVLDDAVAPLWTAMVTDASGYASGTAFDFLGDGSAEAMYADETTLFVFGDNGDPLLTVARESWTQIENPVVVDVDNDGSAEILVASNQGYHGGSTPALQAIRDVEDRWVGARRIWNQHAYFVTNVREDGTIPQVVAPNWDHLNTFRTQAQLEGGAYCQPEPEG